MTLTRAEMAAELDRLNRRSASLPTRPGTCGKPGCTIDHDATLRLLREAALSAVSPGRPRRRVRAAESAPNGDDGRPGTAHQQP